MSRYKLVRMLPDCFKQSEDSNNNKLLSLNEQLISLYKENVSKIDESLDLYNAKGKTLDLYGAMYSQKRGQLEDTRFRYMILTAIAKNMVGANYQSVLDHIVKMFNCNQEDVEISETGDCTVKLTKMPLTVLLSAGFTSKQAVAMVELLLPTCINLEAEVFEGTFCFSDNDNDFDEEAGFDCGTLSMLFGEDEEIPLPI